MKPAALGIVQNQTGKVLLVERRDSKIWVLPGGGIEPGELPENACLRELLEETAVSATIERKAAVLKPLSNLTSLTYIFILKTDAQTARADINECLSAQFFSLDELPKNFFHIHKQWLFECLKSSELIERDLIEVTLAKGLFYGLSHPLQVINYLWTRLKGKISSE